MESSLVLGYWSMRGLGEVVRLFLEYLGQKYSEVKYVERAKWFEEDKPNLKSPFPNIPYLKDGEKVICETDAILYYLALKTGRSDLFGETDQERLELLQIRGVLKDILSGLVAVLYHPNFSEQVVKDGLQPRVLPKYEKLANYLGSKPFLLGDKIKYVDFFFYENIETLKKLDPQTVDRLGLETYCERFRKVAGIAEYLSSPRFTNGPHANPSASKSGI